MLGSRRLPGIGPASVAALALLLAAGCTVAWTIDEEQLAAAQRPRVRLETTLGTMVLELDRVNAPISTANFLRYLDAGFYDNTLFHRVLAGALIQGGGYEPGLVGKQTDAAIPNEASNGLQNLRGTIALARLDAPDSATSQFFINLSDNAQLDASAASAGYAVFGRVVEGIEVADAIGAVLAQTRGAFENVPVEDVIVTSARRVDP